MKNHLEYLKCEFSAEEIQIAARELACSAQLKASIEQRKKEIDASLKAEIEGENSKIARLSSYITTGYEWRNVECAVQLDTPERGNKTIIRNDTGELVKVMRMKDADLQMALDLNVAAEQQEAQASMDGTVQGEGFTARPQPLPQLEAGPLVPEVVDDPELTTDTDGAPLARAGSMGGTHQKKGRK